MKPYTRERIEAVLNWIGTTKAKFDMDIGLGLHYNAENEVCGTVGCLAGQAVLYQIEHNRYSATTKARQLRRLAEGGDRIPLRTCYPGFIVAEWPSVRAQATIYLGLTTEEAEMVFMLHKWPFDMEQRYRQATTPQGRIDAIRARVNEVLSEA